MSEVTISCDLTAEEAEVLIACLTGMERDHPEGTPLGEALKSLRRWRSALLQAWLRSRLVVQR